MMRKGARGAMWGSQIDTDTIHYLPLDSQRWQCWYSRRWWDPATRHQCVCSPVSVSVQHRGAAGCPRLSHARVMSCLSMDEHLIFFIYSIVLYPAVASAGGGDEFWSRAPPSLNDFLRNLGLVMSLYFFRCDGFLLLNESCVSGDFNYEPSACARVCVCAARVRIWW